MKNQNFSIITPFFFRVTWSFRNQPF